MKAQGKTIWFAGLLAVWLAGAGQAAEMVLDRQGSWEVVQSDAGNAATLFLVQTSEGTRTPLASVEVPSATVTNSYWDEYAGRDKATGRPVGAMVTRVDTVTADYRFRAFVNDNNVYWEDWADGTARLWSATCKTPEEKTLLAETEAGMADNPFHAKPWRRGAMWRQVSADGSGVTAMVRANGKTRTASGRELAALAKSKSAKRLTAKEYSGSGSYGYSGSYDYSGSTPDYECQSLIFDANGGQFEDGSLVFDHTDYWPEYRINGTGVYDFWYTDYFQFPIRAGHAFNGWYSAATGGTRLMEGEPVSSDLIRTVYAHWLPTSGTSLAEATDCEKLTFTTEGDVPWFGQKDTSHDGTDAARSGQLPPAYGAGTGSSVLSTTVEGPGSISFQWMADSSDGGAPDDGWGEGETVMEFLVDGTAKASLKERQTGWRKENFDIGDGTHVLKWKYSHEHIWSYQGLDCGFLDQVEWKGPEKQTVTFDANGGSCATATAVYPFDETYGSLPTASRGGYAFAGWFTEAGALVTAESRVEGSASLTLHARWAKFTDGVAIAVTSVRQRFPWNGLVDIDYEVFCNDADAEIWVAPEATDGEHGCALAMETFTGDGVQSRIRAGRHRMTWDAKADNPGAHSFALTVKMTGAKPAAQTIDFVPIGPQTPADRVELTATATSGGTVTFEVVSGPGVIEGNVLTFSGEGLVEVRAVQAGDIRWLSATATQTVQVAKVAQTIDFVPIETQTFADYVELSATATSGGEVTFEVVSGPGVIEGNVLSFTRGGAVIVRAVQAGDDKWLPASVAQMVIVKDASEILYMVVDLSTGSGEDAVCSVSYLEGEPEGGWTDEYKTTKLVLRLILPGSFMMGGTYKTTLTKPYYIGVFEVTQKQYALVMESNPAWFKGDKRPVECVSWDTIRGNSDACNWPNSLAVDADSFIGRLRGMTGQTFDLPTEAQWEYACRAGTTTTYSCGNIADGNYMWEWSNSRRQTHEVGTTLPNAWGLYDMHGNVLEFCLDWFGDLLDGVTDPKGPSSGTFRVQRGGSWAAWDNYCTSSSRGSFPLPADALVNSIDGFRLVRTLPE